MQILYGRSTLFDAYRARLLKKIGSIYPAITRLEMADVYFLDLSSPLSQSEEERLSYLLHPVDAPSALGDAHAVQLYVVPRQGTVSAWSSKASDILHICGLGKVLRIERGRFYRFWSDKGVPDDVHTHLAALVYDRMTEEVLLEIPRAEFVFEHLFPQPLNTFKMGATAYETLAKLNEEYGFAMSQDELQRLADYYRDNGKPATDAELMMFAQVNSEHCRHKLFNAIWTVDDISQEQTLFKMIRSTSECSPDGILVAYDDNAAVLEALLGQTLQVNGDGRYAYTDMPQALSIKVETHNHPTAISPIPGAATGAGGEIRDEVATGRGGKSKAGLTGFCVSKLGIDTASFLQSLYSNHAEMRDVLTEREGDAVVDGSTLCPAIASPLQIMIEAPIGSSSFNNEFGRPGICGYFREFEHRVDDLHFGYHKPIMLAGGLGNLFKSHIKKRKFHAGTPLVVIGGPAMRIGIGGGSASSVGGGQSSQDLDFASVQRDNAEMQRRCQEVINRCVACGDDNPILSIHDVGAGGLSNALPELVHDADLGAVFELDKIPFADKGMSPMEVWCNESQERYVLAIDLSRLDTFLEWCARERCPVAVIGRATDEKHIVLLSDRDAIQPIDMSMDVLFGYLPPVQRSVAHRERPCADSDELAGITLDEAAYRALSAPTVASKSFLITIGDRSVGGLVARDQMVGPWQVPVADVAVSAVGFTDYTGEAMAVGERPPIALLSPQASARVAVAEAILNILAADIAALKDIKLSANWMVAADETEQALALFEAVKAIATDLCPALGVAIPVGKDSVSMRMSWDESGEPKRVVSPLSVVISAFAPVIDIRNTLTPQLSQTEQGSRLFLIDLAAPGNPLGGSCLMQTSDRLGNRAADLKDAVSLKRFASLMRVLREQYYVLAYHDRSDGGLFACLSEMMFAGGCGIACHFDEDESSLLKTLFTEGPGVVLQLNRAGVAALPDLLEQFDLTDSCREIGVVTDDRNFVIESAQQKWCKDMMELKRWWLASSAHIRALRDNPQCAHDEFIAMCDPADPGLSAEWDFASSVDDAHPPHIIGSAPKFAILREQGVNGQMEMAAAFERAGFEVHDVLMNDLLLGQRDLNAFDGMAVCGGFSYGDVLGAGVGWASAALFNSALREMFERFFARENTLTLGVCNGCQMLSHLKEMIPGSEHWQTFEGNQSEVFESRLVRVEITPSPSVFLTGMEGARLPIVISHGEGRMGLTPTAARAIEPYTCLRYIDNHGHADPAYPFNPNGSTNGITGVCNTDGRVTIMMPHPERCFRSVQLSWHPPEWGEDSPWMQLFRNARAWYR